MVFFDEFVKMLRMKELTGVKRFTTFLLRSVRGSVRIMVEIGIRMRADADRVLPCDADGPIYCRPAQ